MKFANRDESIVVGVLSFWIIDITLGVVGLAFKVPIQQWYAPVAFLLANTLCYALSPRYRILNCLSFSLCVFVSIFLSALPVMYSTTDGDICYRAGVEMLVDGWNPLVTTEVDEVLAKWQGFRPWNLLYACKLHWVFSASLYKCFGFSGITDAMNFMAFGAGFCSFRSWIRMRYEISSIRAFVMSITACMSPSFISMAFGGKNDAIMLLGLTILMCTVDQYFKDRRSNRLLTILMICPIMMGIKVTGLIQFVSIVGLFCAVNWRTCEKCVGAGLLSILLAILLNASPVITNILKHGTPFYPFSAREGEKPDVSMTIDFDYMNDDAAHMGAVGKFVRAYVSEDLAFLYYKCFLGKKDFSPNWPYLFTQPIGYGALFRCMFITSWIAFFFIREKSIKLMMVALLLTAIMVPAKYIGYARFVQQIYLIPILAVLGLYIRFRDDRLSQNILLMPLLVLYSLLLGAKHLVFIPYAWVSSVQSLQILDVVENDASAIIEAESFNGRWLWSRDACMVVSVKGAMSDSTDNNLFRYGPLARRYSYVSRRPISAPFYSFEFVKAGMNLDKRRSGVEKFFLREFLPNEIKLFPTRARQWARLRSRQVSNAWRCYR